MDTESRKQAEEIAARDFIKSKHPQDYEDIPQWHIEDLEAYAALKVAEATKEMYPKEFILWKDANAEYDEEEDLYFTTTDEMMGIGTWLTFEAVFEYWKQNIQEK